MKRKRQWVKRAIHLGDQVRTFLDKRVKGNVDNAPIVGLIEFPSLWSKSKVSMAGASRGDHYILAALCGIYLNEFVRIGAQVHMLNPSDWKGTLPKHLVTKRLTAHMIKNRSKWQHFFMERHGVLRDHETDAIGMAIWFEKDRSLEVKFSSKRPITLVQRYLYRSETLTTTPLIIAIDPGFGGTGIVAMYGAEYIASEVFRCPR